MTKYEEKGSLIPEGTYSAELVDFVIQPGRTCLLVRMQFMVYVESTTALVTDSIPLCNTDCDSLFIDNNFKGTVYLQEALDSLGIPKGALGGNRPLHERLADAIGVKSTVDIKEREWNERIFNAVFNWRK